MLTLREQQWHIRPGVAGVVPDQGERLAREKTGKSSIERWIKVPILHLSYAIKPLAAPAPAAVTHGRPENQIRADLCEDDGRRPKDRPEHRHADGGEHQHADANEAGEWFLHHLSAASSAVNHRRAPPAHFAWIAYSIDSAITYSTPSTATGVLLIGLPTSTFFGSAFCRPALKIHTSPSAVPIITFPST